MTLAWGFLDLQGRGMDGVSPLSPRGWGPGSPERILPASRRALLLSHIALTTIPSSFVLEELGRPRRCSRVGRDPLRGLLPSLWICSSALESLPISYVPHLSPCVSSISSYVSFSLSLWVSTQSSFSLPASCFPSLSLSLFWVPPTLQCLSWHPTPILQHSLSAVPVSRGCSPAGPGPGPYSNSSG